MIDTFSIVLSHGLLAIMVWRLLHRPDLDHEDDLPDFGNGPEGKLEQQGSNRFGQNQPSSQKGFRSRA